MSGIKYSNSSCTSLFKCRSQSCVNGMWGRHWQTINSKFETLWTERHKSVCWRRQILASTKKNNFISSSWNREAKAKVEFDFRFDYEPMRSRFILRGEERMPKSEIRSLRRAHIITPVGEFELFGFGFLCLHRQLKLEIKEMVSAKKWKKMCLRLLWFRRRQNCLK